MNVLVCIKQVPDTETKIQIKEGRVDLGGVKWIMNPYDEFAVEEALKLKADNPSAKTFVLSVGPKGRVVESLRTALAMGIDEAVLIDTAELADPFLVSKALSKAVKKLGDFGAVFCGMSSGDNNNLSVGQMVAEFLDVPHVTCATKSDYSDQKALYEREIEGGAKEVIEVSFPAVITTNKGINSPRYASLPGIMKAKKKPVQEITLEHLGLSNEKEKICYSGFEAPKEREPVQMIDGDSSEQAKKLVQLLRDTAKVI